jgi:hypothetical protein
MFVVLWGALATAYALTLLFRGRIRAEHLAAVVALGVAVAPCLAPHHSTGQDTPEQQVANPDIGRGGAKGVFILALRIMARNGFPQHGVNRAEWHYGIIDSAQRLLYPGTGELPAPASGDVLHVEGFVPPEHGGPVTLTITLDDTEVAAAPLQPSFFMLAVPITTPFERDWVRIRLQTDRYLDIETREPVAPSPGALALQVGVLLVEDRPPRTDTKPVLAAEAIRTTTRYGPPTVCRVHADRTCLAQLPVFFYPGMLRVRDNGRVVRHGNLGVYAALELAPGDHVVAIRFVGVRWANGISVAAALGLLAAWPAARAWRSLRRRTRRAAPAPEIALPRAA